MIFSQIQILSIFKRLLRDLIAADVFYRFEMSELRRRKATPGKDRNRHSSHANGRSKGQQTATELHGKEGVCWYSYGNFLLGAVVALIVGAKYALYVREIHENDMWFSNIGVRSFIICELIPIQTIHSCTAVAVMFKVCTADREMA